jgi:hypothetical protein
MSRRTPSMSRGVATRFTRPTFQASARDERIEIA